MRETVIQAIDTLEAFMAGVDDALALPRDAAEFVRTLILATGARRGVEIGTSYGYSGLWTASALADNGGGLVTIDCEQRKSDAARRAFASAELLPHVDVRTGAAVDILPTLEGPFDFVLNDADKENCVRYVELLADKLSDRAVVLTDNTHSHPTQLADFVRWIRRNPHFESVSVPIGNGMELSTKRGCS